MSAILLIADATLSTNQVLLLISILASVAAPILILIGCNIISTRRYRNRLIDEADPTDERADEKKKGTGPGWIAILIGVGALVFAISSWAFYIMDGQVNPLNRMADNRNGVDAEDLDDLAADGDWDLEWEDPDENRPDRPGIGEQFGNNPDLDNRGQAFDPAIDEGPEQDGRPSPDDAIAGAPAANPLNNEGAPGRDLNENLMDRDPLQNQRDRRAPPARFRQPRNNAAVQVPPRRPRQDNAVNIGNPNGNGEDSQTMGIQVQPPGSNRIRSRPKIDRAIPANPNGGPVNGQPSSSTGTSSVRDWQNEDGSFRFRGSYRGGRSGSVILVSDTGSVVTYPIKDLSKKDRDWLDAHGVKSASSNGRFIPPAEMARRRANLERARAESNRRRPGGTGNNLSADPNRTWTSSDGRQRIRATFEKRVGSRVYLLNSDGEKISLPFDRFSDADKEWIKTHGNPQAGSNGRIRMTTVPMTSLPKLTPNPFESLNAINATGDLLLSQPASPTMIVGQQIWSHDGGTASTFQKTGQFDLDGEFTPRAICPSGRQVAGLLSRPDGQIDLVITDQRGQQVKVLREDWLPSAQSDFRVKFAHERLFVGLPGKRRIHVWDTRSHQIVGSMSVSRRIAAELFDVSAEGDRMVFVDNDEIHFVDTTTGEAINQLVLPSTEHLLPRQRNNSFRLLEGNGPTTNLNLGRHLKSLTISPDGRKVMAIVQVDLACSIYVWEEDGRLTKQFQYLPAEPEVRQVHWLGDKGWLINSEIIESDFGMVVGYFGSGNQSVVPADEDWILVAHPDSSRVQGRRIPWVDIRRSLAKAKGFIDYVVGPPTAVGLIIQLPKLTREQALSLEQVVAEKLASQGMRVSADPKMFFEFGVTSGTEVQVGSHRNGEPQIPANHLYFEMSHNSEAIVRVDLGPFVPISDETMPQLLEQFRAAHYPFYIGTDTTDPTLPLRFD